MAILTDQEYYEDSTKWGEGTFVTLESIIQNIRLTASDDSHFKKTKKFVASIHGKQLLKKLNVDLKTQDKAISFQLPATKIFPFPKYMTNWSRISVFNKCEKLSRLAISTRPLIHDYLQDHNTELLYDNDGNVLIGKTFDASEGYCCLTVDPCEIAECSCSEEDFSESFVRENKAGGYFEFSDDLVDRLIIVEFQSAGLEGIDDCDIKIPNALEMVLTNGIKWKIAEGNRNTPMSEVLYFKGEYKIEKERARHLLADKISIEQIIKSVSLRYNS